MSDPANAQQYAARMRELSVELGKQMSKMSPEERMKFWQKWGPEMARASFEGMFKNFNGFGGNGMPRVPMEVPNF